LPGNLPSRINELGREIGERQRVGEGYGGGTEEGREEVADTY